MKKQTESKQATHRQHAPEYRAEALALAVNVGVSQAANELGLHESQMYGWSFRLAFLAHKANEFSLTLRAACRRSGPFNSPDTAASEGPFSGSERASRPIYHGNHHRKHSALLISAHT